MTRIGLFYGSTDGHTAAVAAEIKAHLDQEYGNQEYGDQENGRGNELVELLDVAEVYLEEMLAFDRLILGVPTWNTGQLQRDWDEVLDELDDLDLSSKRVALFGLGDQLGYPDTFADALAFVADKVRDRGASVVGAWPADGYHFQASWACTGGSFVGLVLDEHNQADLTPLRLRRWLAQVMQEFDPATATA